MMIIGRIFEDTLTGLPAYNIIIARKIQSSRLAVLECLIRKLLKPGVAINYEFGSRNTRRSGEL